MNTVHVHVHCSMFMLANPCFWSKSCQTCDMSHVFTNKAKVEDEVTLFETWGLLRFQIKWGAKYRYCQIIVSIMSWPSDLGWGSMNVFAKDFFWDISWECRQPNHWREHFSWATELASAIFCSASFWASERKCHWWLNPMKSNNVKILFVEMCVVKKHFGGWEIHYGEGTRLLRHGGVGHNHHVYNR